MGRCVIIQLKKNHNIYTAARIGFNHVHNTFIWKHPNYVFTWQKEPLQLPWHIKPFYKPACLCLYPRDLHQLHVYDYLYKSMKYINNSIVKIHHHSILDFFFSSFQIPMQCFFLGALQIKNAALLSRCPPSHTHRFPLLGGCCWTPAISKPEAQKHLGEKETSVRNSSNFTNSWKEGAKWISGLTTFVMTF